MTADLEAASRCRFLALYDPAAIPPDFPLDPDLEAQEPEPPPDDAIEALAAAGLALVVHIPEDCEADLRLFVDEPLPDHLAAITSVPTLAGAVLRVPSGTLKADGIEFMELPGVRREHSSADTITVEPSDYRLQCRSFLHWKAAHRQKHVAEATTSLERWGHRLINALGCLAVLLLLAMFLGLPGLGVYLGRHGWRTDVVIAAALFVVVATFVIWAAFRFIEYAQGRFPALTRARAAYDAFDRRYPDLVVILERVRGSDPVPESVAPSLLRTEEGGQTRRESPKDFAAAVL